MGIKDKTPFERFKEATKKVLSVKKSDLKNKEKPKK